MKNLGDLNNWTKNDLARVIGQALFNTAGPLAADNWQVKQWVKNHKKDILVDRCTHAIEIISKRKVEA